MVFTIHLRWLAANTIRFPFLTSDKTPVSSASKSSLPRSWSLGNATLVVADRSGWRRVLSASKLRPSAKGAHRYRKRAGLEALRLATTKLTQRGTGYTSWGHPTQLRISWGSIGLNPFEIILLQTTRKENNWKTEEALARAALTVETERIKGSNPWCLLWWWW